MFGVFDQLGNLGDETDASSSDEDSDERLFVGSQLWLVWLGTENSGFLCGLLQQESSCTAPPNLHERFWVCKAKVPQVMLQSFPKGWFPMSTAELF